MSKLAIILKDVLTAAVFIAIAMFLFYAAATIGAELFGAYGDVICIVITFLILLWLASTILGGRIDDSIDSELTQKRRQKITRFHDGSTGE